MTQIQIRIAVITLLLEPLITETTLVYKLTCYFPFLKGIYVKFKYLNRGPITTVRSSPQFQIPKTSTVDWFPHFFQIQKSKPRFSLSSLSSTSSSGVQTSDSEVCEREDVVFRKTQKLSEIKGDKIQIEDQSMFV